MRNIDNINEKMRLHELDYSFVYLISKKWVDLYRKYLEDKVQGHLSSFNIDNYKDLNYFNQDVLEREIIAEKFYKYQDDSRGLNYILKENLKEEDFQIFDMNTINFVKARFKGTILKREVKSKGNSESLIEFVPFRVKKIKWLLY